MLIFKLLKRDNHEFAYPGPSGPKRPRDFKRTWKLNISVQRV